MTKPNPKREVFCVDCGWHAGWIEGRGRQPLRCWPCGQVHLRDYNRQAKRAERLQASLSERERAAGGVTYQRPQD